MAYPKVIAFDLDNTLWAGWLGQDNTDSLEWVGIAPEDNLVIEQNQIIRGSSNWPRRVKVSRDIFKIVSDLLWNDVKIAIVSRNTNKALCDRAMWLLRIADPRTGRVHPFTDCIMYNEIIDEPKCQHFRRIHNWSGAEYHEMLLFDDEPRNSEVELWQGTLSSVQLIRHLANMLIGVTFHKVRDLSEGLSWADYRKGLDVWRRNQLIRRNMPGEGPDPLPNRMCVGYVGTDFVTAHRYKSGMRRPKSKRPSRWGWGMYVTDDSRIAAEFCIWGRKNDSPDNYWFCPVFVRDFEVFRRMNKVWVSESGSISQTDNMNSSDEEIAKSQIDRDEQIALDFNIEKPYILFSKHRDMASLRGTSLSPRPRFNEMVVYPQIQDALFYGRPVLLDHTSVPNWVNFRYHKKVNDWNITCMRRPIQ